MISLYAPCLQHGQTTALSICVIIILITPRIIQISLEPKLGKVIFLFCLHHNLKYQVMERDFFKNSVEYNNYHNQLKFSKLFPIMAPGSFFFTNLHFLRLNWIPLNLTQNDAHRLSTSWG